MSEQSRNRSGFGVLGVVLLLLLALTACQPAEQQALAEPLPTLANAQATALPSIESAATAAINFLENWRLGDYQAMYNLVSFSSREASPFETFAGIYQRAASEMTLDGITYSPGNSLYRDSNRSDVVIFNYNVVFQTRLLGEFADNGRNMQLVFDPQAGDWRVAWTPGDILAELSGGAELRLDLNLPSRANIYDKNGKVLADQSGRVVIVSAVKQSIPDWAACINLLAFTTGRSLEVLQAIYDQSASDWNVDFGQMAAEVYNQNSTQLEITCGATFRSFAVRQYVNSTSAANIVGTVGYPSPEQVATVEAAGFNSDSIIGQSGIEQSWDTTLRGKPGGRLLIVSPGGQVLREVARTPAQPAQSVWLTIDVDVQNAIQTIIAQYYQQFQFAESKGASVVVIDVKTGAILAMVSYPTYDANAFAPFPIMGASQAAAMVAELQADPRRPLLNRPTQGAYPLGSVMKIVSTLAVADSGVYTLDQPFVCGGQWTRDIVRRDWLAGGHGRVTLGQALTRSCNPYYYEVGYQMNQVDPYLLPGYQQRFFGSGSGLTDLAENSGFIPDPDWKRRTLGYDWTFSDAVNISIGQGEVQVTPLQVVRMVAAVANGGTLLRPQLVQKAGILGEVPVHEMEVDVMGDMGIRAEVIAVAQQAMCDVTSTQAGTAEYQFRNDPELQNIGVCGKTGTAQDVPRTTHAWFAAYAPRDNPQIAVVVMVENSGEGSGVAAPITRDVMNFFFFGRMPPPPAAP